MPSVAAALIGVSLVAGCAHYPVNKPLPRYDREYGYRFSSIPAAASEDETFVILAFSGGGTRAAALAYAVLQHLARTSIDRGRRTLLEEVDVISSVSGGSFTAAFYEQCRQLLRDACPSARLPEGELAPVEFYPVEVTFAAIADPAERRFFNDIGTNYSLSDEQVTRLIELGPKLLDASPVFRALVDRLK